MAGEGERQVIALQWTVKMGKPDPDVKLGVARHAFFNAGHPDEYQTDVAAVEQMASSQGRLGTTLEVLMSIGRNSNRFAWETR